MRLLLKGKFNEDYYFSICPFEPVSITLNRVYAITKRYKEDNGEFYHDLISIGYCDDENVISENEIKHAKALNATHISFFEPANKKLVAKIIEDIKEANPLGIEN